MDDLDRVIDEMTAPVVVACVECGKRIVLAHRPRLYCSDACHQTLKLIHYGRTVMADGRIERDPTIAEAIQMRIAQILAGGYHEVKRRVPPALRAQVFERDGGQCVLCGAPATQIDHIARDANTIDNLRAACGTCNLGMAQSRLVRATGKRAAQAEQLIDRILAPAPLFPRDDQSTWSVTYRGLMGERGGRLRQQRAILRLIERARKGLLSTRDLSP